VLQSLLFVFCRGFTGQFVCVIFSISDIFNLFCKWFATRPMITDNCYKLSCESPLKWLHRNTCTFYLYLQLGLLKSCMIPAGLSFILVVFAQSLFLYPNISQRVYGISVVLIPVSIITDCVRHYVMKHISELLVWCACWWQSVACLNVDIKGGMCAGHDWMAKLPRAWYPWQPTHRLSSLSTATDNAAHAAETWHSSPQVSLSTESHISISTLILLVGSVGL